MDAGRDPDRRRTIAQLTSELGDLLEDPEAVRPLLRDLAKHDRLALAAVEAPGAIEADAEVGSHTPLHKVPHDLVEPDSR